MLLNLNSFFTISDAVSKKLQEDVTPESPTPCLSKDQVKIEWILLWVVNERRLYLDLDFEWIISFVGMVSFSASY